MEIFRWENTSNKTRYLNRFLSILFGIFITSTGLEITHNNSPTSILKPVKKHVDKYEKTYNILCTGDSFTYGTGAFKNKSYPAHLQRSLNEKVGKGKIKVFNTGRPGQNSSEMADAFLTQLDRTKAKMVIILVGHNNFWNFHNLHLNLAKTSTLSFSDAQLDDYYRYQFSCALKEKCLIEIDELEDYLCLRPRDIDIIIHLAFLHREINNQKEYKRLLDSAYQIDAQKTEEILNDIQMHYRAKNEVVEYTLKLNKEDRRHFRRLFLTIINRTDSEDERYNIQQDILREVLQKDITWMVNVAGKRGLKVIISSYPRKEWAGPLIEDITSGLNVPFVSHIPIFQKLVGQSSYGDYFGFDKHCTNSGYRIMAENIAEVVCRELEKK